MKKIPLHSLVLFISSPRNGIAQQRFPHYEIVSMESIFHSLVGDTGRYDLWDYAQQQLTNLIKLKLDVGERVVIEGNLTRKEERIRLTEHARKLGIPIFYVIHNGNNTYEDRYNQNLRNNLKEILRGDTFATVIDLSIDAMEAITKLEGNNLYEQLIAKGFRGVTAVGDVHGMLESVKMISDWSGGRGTFLMFSGDIVDYGPNGIECIEFVYELVVRGRGAVVIGNHERKILKWFDQSRSGNVKLQLSSANRVTVDTILQMSTSQREKFENKFRALINLSRNHWRIANAVFTHGAIDPQMYNVSHARLTGKMETYALYGEIDPMNKTREDGYPNRIYNWVNTIPAGHLAIVGHDIRSMEKPLTVSGSLGGEAIFMDTGSGKGGRLSTCDLIFKDGKFLVQNFNVV
jgi:protein phosphatase